MSRDVALVVAASALLRRGLSDDVVRSYLARVWSRDEAEFRAAIGAAHILLRREASHLGGRDT